MPGLGEGSMWEQEGPCAPQPSSLHVSELQVQWELCSKIRSKKIPGIKYVLHTHIHVRVCAHTYTLAHTHSFTYHICIHRQTTKQSMDDKADKAFSGPLASRRDKQIPGLKAWTKTEFLTLSVSEFTPLVLHFLLGSFFSFPHWFSLHSLISSSYLWPSSPVRTPYQLFPLPLSFPTPQIHKAKLHVCDLQFPLYLFIKVVLWSCGLGCGIQRMTIKVWLSPLPLISHV